jgi:hypothetical protein
VALNGKKNGLRHRRLLGVHLQNYRRNETLLQRGSGIFRKDIKLKSLRTLRKTFAHVAVKNLYSAATK